MINLLPPEDKIAIKKEYLRRFFVVAGLFFASATLVSIVFLLLTFFFLAGYKKDLSRQAALSSQRAETLNLDAIVSEIMELNSRINILKSRKENLGLSFILEKIIGTKAEGVKITGLGYEGSKGTEKAKISISGGAKKRQDLLVFITSLEKEFGAENVLSPVSNLLNEKDAVFSLTVLDIK